MTTDLMELASRVEAGEGDTREMFEAAYTAIHGMSWQAAAYHHGSSGGEPDQAKQEAAFRFGELIRVGAWLDAAMTLVPEGYFVTTITDPGGIGYAGVASHPDEVGPPCATVVLALCAAALKARAHVER